MVFNPKLVELGVHFRLFNANNHPNTEFSPLKKVTRAFRKDLRIKIPKNKHTTADGVLNKVSNILKTKYGVTSPFANSDKLVFLAQQRKENADTAFPYVPEPVNVGARWPHLPFRLCYDDEGKPHLSVEVASSKGPPTPTTLIGWLGVADANGELDIDVEERLKMLQEAGYGEACTLEFQHDRISMYPYIVTESLPPSPHTATTPPVPPTPPSSPTLHQEPQWVIQQTEDIRIEDLLFEATTLLSAKNSDRRNYYCEWTVSLASSPVPEAEPEAQPTGLCKRKRVTTSTAPGGDAVGQSARSEDRGAAKRAKATATSTVNQPVGSGSVSVAGPSQPRWSRRLAGIPGPAFPSDVPQATGTGKKSAGKGRAASGKK